MKFVGVNNILLPHVNSNLVWLAKIKGRGSRSRPQKSVFMSFIIFQSNWFQWGRTKVASTPVCKRQARTMNFIKRKTRKSSRIIPSTCARLERTTTTVVEAKLPDRSGSEEREQTRFRRWHRNWDNTCRKDRTQCHAACLMKMKQAGSSMCLNKLIRFNDLPSKFSYAHMLRKWILLGR